MKALTVTQPWATLIALRAKPYETRSWYTSYRGPLGIHAASRFPEDAQYLCFQKPFRDCLGDYVQLGNTYLGNHKFPLGAMIATCDLVDIQPTHVISDLVGERDLVFGDWTPGRWAWKLENVQLLPEPVPVKGHLGLWNWEGGG